MKYHLGCGNKKIQGFVNVDIVQTAATDFVYDFGNGVPFITTDTAEFIFSNAVFEHLHPFEQIKLMKDCKRSLSNYGSLAFTGIPDFESVSRAYLNGYPSNAMVGEKFGLYDATRYTHGGIGNCGWSEQDIFSYPMLHKALVDANHLSRILDYTEYGSYIIFKYLWGQEPTYATLGILAKKASGQYLDLQRELSVVQQQTNVNWDSLQIIKQKGLRTHPLKIIGLVPVRNEAHIIEQCLKALACYTDAIVVLDDASEDDTIGKIKAVAAECRVESIICKTEWYRDEPSDKNSLLKEGRRLGGTHFIIIDADEIFTANLKENNLLRNAILELKKGDKLFLDLISLWRSTDYYRFDNSFYSKQIKEMAFCDDGKCLFNSEFIHTPRVPRNLIEGQNYKIQNPPERYECGVLHFQFIHWENSLIKQAWYRCLERIRLPQKSVLEINKCYAVTKDETNIELNKSPENWFAYPFFDKGVYEQPTLYKKQVLKWFNEYGKEYFSDLDIWDVQWE